MPRGLPEDLYLRFCSGAYRRQRARGSPLPAGRRVVIEDFRQDYNAERPHSSLGYLSRNASSWNNLYQSQALGWTAKPVRPSA